MKLNKFSKKFLNCVFVLGIIAPSVINKAEVTHATVNKGVKTNNYTTFKFYKPKVGHGVEGSPKLQFLLQAAGMIKEKGSGLPVSGKLQSMIDRAKKNDGKYNTQGVSGVLQSIKLGKTQDGGMDSIITKSVKDMIREMETKLAMKTPEGSIVKTTSDKKTDKMVKEDSGVIYETYRPVKDVAKDLEGKLVMRVPGDFIKPTSGKKSTKIGENSEIVYEAQRPVKDLAKELEDKLIMRRPDGTIVYDPRKTQDSGVGHSATRVQVESTGVDIKAMAGILESKLNFRTTQSDKGKIDQKVTGGTEGLAVQAVKTPAVDPKNGIIYTATEEINNKDTANIK